MRNLKIKSAQSVKLPQQKRSIDLSLLVTVVLLLIFGLIMVYDSSTSLALSDFKDSTYYLKQQTIWVVLGVVLGSFFIKFDYHILKKISLPLLIGSLALLVAVLIPGLGVSGGGAHRWLNLGILTVQPAEIIKLTGAIYLASVFEKGPRLKSLLVVVGLITLITAVLQKDLGSATVFVLTSVVMYFVSGAAIYQFVAIIPIASIAFLLLVLSSTYRKQRVLAFFDPFSDSQGFSYHISQILLALGSGGLFGRGLGQSRQKLEYLPEVTTDSIFAVIGEEFGFLGGIIIIGLFCMLIVKGFKIASECNDNFGRMLAVGLTSWLGIQAIINLSSMTALLPLTGVPLPFISYGGSALVANLTAVGILLNISRNRIIK